MFSLEAQAFNCGDLIRRIFGTSQTSANEASTQNTGSNQLDFSSLRWLSDFEKIGFPNSEHHRNRINERLQGVAQRHQPLIRGANGAELFHGTNSASLLSLSSDRSSRGIFPTFKLRENNIPAFSGERLHLGRTTRINNHHLSTVRLPEVDVALNYAAKPYYSFSLDHINKMIVERNLSIERAKQQLSEISETNQAPPVSLNFKESRENLLKIISEDEQYVKDLENSVEQFSQLSSFERKFVTDPFPMLWGIQPSALSDQTRVSLYVVPAKDSFFEAALKNGATIDEIRVLYVPKDKIALVRDYLKANDAQHIHVEPIDESLRNRDVMTHK